MLVLGYVLLMRRMLEGDAGVELLHGDGDRLW